MNAAQVTTLGGTCELLGLVTVAWGLVDVASYRGDLARIRAWLDARRRTVVANVRKLLRRPGRSVVVHAGAAVASATAFGAMAKGMRGPFTPRPGQSLEDQIAELGLLVNRLREELLTQDREHRQEIDTLRKQTDDKLQAERARAEAALNAVREARANASTGQAGRGERAA
jgi:tRNA U34 5-carboxymethylaminomethyl modifying enzyme MnmG/GidA